MGNSVRIESNIGGYLPIIITSPSSNLISLQFSIKKILLLYFVKNNNHVFNHDLIEEEDDNEKVSCKMVMKCFYFTEKNLQIVS
jgi:hypothetical protein